MRILAQTTWMNKKNPRNFLNPLWKKNQGGFTLTELLVVVALIGIITGLFFSRGNTFFRLSIDTATRKFAPTVKETYNHTLLTGRIHRIVYDLKENSYWVEMGPKDFLLETQEYKEKNKSIFSKKESEDGFQIEKTITPKKRSLPGGVVFDKIYTEQDIDPIKEGTAYTYFFPHGITEQTVIHLIDVSNNKKTLAITPLVGNTIVENNHLSRGEIYGD